MKTIRTAWQVPTEKNFYKLPTGVRVTKEELEKLIALNPDLLWIVVNYQKQIIR